MKEFKLEVTYYNAKGIESLRKYEFDDERKAQEKYSAWNRILENEKKLGHVTICKIVLYKVYMQSEA